MSITEPRLRGRIELAWRTEAQVNKAAVLLISDARCLEDAPGKIAATIALFIRRI
jgi:hypothetical protein